MTDETAPLPGILHVKDPIRLSAQAFVEQNNLAEKIAKEFVNRGFPKEIAAPAAEDLAHRLTNTLMFISKQPDPIQAAKEYLKKLDEEGKN